jgi:putative transposase
LSPCETHLFPITALPNRGLDLFGALRAAESIGRPLGNARFLARIERQTGRILKAGKRGPKPSAPDDK